MILEVLSSRKGGIAIYEYTFKIGARGKDSRVVSQVYEVVSISKGG